MTRPPRLITELVGTFIFLSVIALSGPAGPLAPLVIGTALMAMVYMGGHISGAHYNPAVSFGAFLSRKLGAVDMAGYWVAQLVGSALAFTFGYLVSNHSPGIHPGLKVQLYQALAVEIVFTAALVLVVLAVAASRATQGNSCWRADLRRCLQSGCRLWRHPGVGSVRKWRLVGLLDLRRRSVHRGSDRSRHPPPAGRRRGSTMMKSPTGSLAGRAADRAGRR